MPKRRGPERTHGASAFQKGGTVRVTGSPGCRVTTPGNTRAAPCGAALWTPWCPGRDLNSHGFPHTPLKRTCLPIPPPGHGQSGEADYSVTWSSHPPARAPASPEPRARPEHHPQAHPAPGSREPTPPGGPRSTTGRSVWRSSNTPIPVVLLWVQASPRPTARPWPVIPSAPLAASSPSTARSMARPPPNSPSN